MSRKLLTDPNGEVRELTRADMRAMRPFAEMHPELAATLPAREATATGAKQAINLWLDPDIVAHFKAAGPGWQSRINDALRKAIRSET